MNFNNLNVKENNLNSSIDETKQDKYRMFLTITFMGTEF